MTRAMLTYVGRSTAWVSCGTIGWSRSSMKCTVVQEQTNRPNAQARHRYVIMSSCLAEGRDVIEELTSRSEKAVSVSSLHISVADKC